MASTEMAPYFYVLGYLYKWFNNVQGIQEPETNINNGTHIWVQGVMNNKGGVKTVFLKVRSPELDLTANAWNLSPAEEMSTKGAVEQHYKTFSSSFKRHLQLLLFL